MEDLKQALTDFPHVLVVYMVGDEWYFNKPNVECKELTRDEILQGAKKKTKASADTDGAQ
jgi:hypothetical protein